MKQIMKLGICLIMVLGLAGPAVSATATLYEDLNISCTAPGCGDWTFDNDGSGNDLDYYLDNYTITSLELTVTFKDLEGVSAINPSTSVVTYTGEIGVIAVEDSTFDSLAVIGCVKGTTLSETIDVLGFLSQLQADDTFFIFYSTEGDGTFDGFTVTSATLEVEYTHTPIPTSALLFTFGLAAILGVQRITGKHLKP